MELLRDVGLQATWALRATLLSEFFISVKDMIGLPGGVQVRPAGASSCPSEARFFIGSRPPATYNQPSLGQEGDGMLGPWSW